MRADARPVSGHVTFQTGHSRGDKGRWAAVGGHGQMGTEGRGGDQFRRGAGKHRGDRSVLHLDYCGGYVTIHTFVTARQTAYLKWVDFTSRKSYLDTAGVFVIVCLF